ncbi:hypothetical protein [Pedobacter antarcticus]|uniref:hypothetical protein n=1 Tax=Pedobacter antarcticus TaxID=34086 RepID=UPI00088E3082|nr:hypothetical protein [Pedobacter antarcticus]SDM40472.1 hypothetical protein SAMN04488084_106167 [Pedobacter antarcticus]
MEESKYGDNVLFQRVEQIFIPAESWLTCEMPMTTEEMVLAIHANLPGYFPDNEKVLQIMEQLHFKFERNEFNNKRYWLLNPA